jgi:hypothetical protein
MNGTQLIIVNFFILFNNIFCLEINIIHNEKRSEVIFNLDGKQLHVIREDGISIKKNLLVWADFLNDILIIII